MTRSCRSIDGFASHSTVCVYSHLIAGPGSRSARQISIPQSTIVKISISHHTRSIRSLRGDPVADPGDDLERSVSRILIVDEGQDHQLVGTEDGVALRTRCRLGQSAVEKSQNTEAVRGFILFLS